ncbi:hypothetical protein Tco_0334085, partial [Tanacetum coccineum]
KETVNATATTVSVATITEVDITLAQALAELNEANIALTEEWNDIQANIDVDYQLAQRLQAKEQEELTDAEKVRLFVQLLEKRRKHFAAKRAEEQRNKPPTKAQQKNTMITYLKKMEAELLKENSKKVEAEIAQESLKKAEVMKGSSKRAGD